jgi:hypothetical protein
VTQLAIDDFSQHSHKREAAVFNRVGPGRTPDPVERPIDHLFFVNL